MALTFLVASLVALNITGFHHRIASGRDEMFVLVYFLIFPLRFSKDLGRIGWFYIRIFQGKLEEYGEFPASCPQLLWRRNTLFFPWPAKSRPGGRFGSLLGRGLCKILLHVNGKCFFVLQTTYLQSISYLMYTHIWVLDFREYDSWMVSVNHWDVGKPEWGYLRCLRAPDIGSVRSSRKRPIRSLPAKVPSLLCTIPAQAYGNIKNGLVWWPWKLLQRNLKYNAIHQQIRVRQVPAGVLQATISPIPCP